MELLFPGVELAAMIKESLPSRCVSGEVRGCMYTDDDWYPYSDCLHHSIVRVTQHVKSVSRLNVEDVYKPAIPSTHNNTRGLSKRDLFRESDHWLSGTEGLDPLRAVNGKKVEATIRVVHDQKFSSFVHVDMPARNDSVFRQIDFAKNLITYSREQLMAVVEDTAPVAALTVTLKKSYQQQALRRPAQRNGPTYVHL